MVARPHLSDCGAGPDAEGGFSRPTAAGSIQEVLQETMARELRALGQQLLRDARAEFRRLAEQQAITLQHLLVGTEGLRAVSRGAAAPQFADLPHCPSTPCGHYGLSAAAGEGPRAIGRPATASPPQPPLLPSVAPREAPRGFVAWGLGDSGSLERPQRRAATPAAPERLAEPGELWGSGRCAVLPDSRRILDPGDRGDLAIRRQRSGTDFRAADGTPKVRRLQGKGSASEKEKALKARSTKRRLSPVVGNDVVAMLDRFRKRDRSQPSSVRRLSGMMSDPSRSMREVLEVFVHCDLFGYMMGVFHIMNAISVGVQVDYSARHPDQPGFSMPLDIFFCALFSLELSLRILAQGRRFFATTATWNYFDFVLVAFSLFDIVAQHVALGEQPANGVTSNFGVLRLLRLVRIVRLVRFIRLFPQLKSMVYLIRASMVSFFWTLMLMLMLVYGFAVYFTEIVIDVRRQDFEDLDPLQVSSCWGTMGDSMLSLFMAMTGGDDWRNFLDIFRVDPTLFWSNTLVFSLYVAFMMLVMLNLVTGVFVDGAARIFQQDKEHELLAAAAAAFDKADVDHNASLSRTEFLAIVQESALDDYCEALGISVHDADRLFCVLDEDNSGEVDVLEFMMGTLRLRGTARATDLAAFQYQVKICFADVTAAVGELARSVERISRSHPRLDDDFGIEDV